jgi:hypothetical protein
MVSTCLNTACHEEFKVLNAGDLYALDTTSSEPEFFWLCKQCAALYDVCRDLSGRVSLRPRDEVSSRQPPTFDGTLRLIARSLKPLPRLNTVPSGERTRVLFFPRSTARRARRGGAYR